MFATAPDLEDAFWEGAWAEADSGLQPPPREGELQLMLNSHEKLAALRVPDESAIRFWYGASGPEEDLGPCFVSLHRGNPDSQRLAFEAFTRRLGIFIWTRSPIEDVRQSLLRFAIGIFPDGPTRLLPFYEPTLVEGFLTMAPIPWLDELFRTVVAIFMPRPSDEHLVITQWDQGTLRGTQWHLPSQMSLSTQRRPNADADLPGADLPDIEREPQIGAAPSRHLVVRDNQLEALASAQVRRRVGVPPGKSAAAIGVVLGRALATRVKQAAHQKLVDALTDNLHANHPNLARLYSVPDFELMVETSVRRAASHGLTQPKALFEFAKLMFLIAPNFDAHPVMRSHLSQQKLVPEERLSRGIQAMSTRDWEQAQRDSDAATWGLAPLR